MVVAAVLRRREHLLLCHRSPGRRWFPDVWGLPGGHVEPGEAPERALRRELQEELGIELLELDGAPVLEHVEPSLELTVWLLRRWRGTPVNRQPQEHDAINWFGRDQIDRLNLAFPSYRALFKRLVDPPGADGADGAGATNQVRRGPAPV
ncbi:MAG: NUDIX domain-containing protein [Candidatus Dormibacteria bacterium]